MLNFTAPCSTADEAVFGPEVSSNCLQGFDFTLLFEETILTILPLCICLLLTPLRVRHLLASSIKTKRSWTYLSKGFAYLIFAALQLALLIIWAASPNTTSLPLTQATIPTQALLFAGFVALCYLSHLEHLYSPRPSTLLNIYLGLSVLLDLARTRTLWFLPNSHVVASIWSTSFAIKVVILSLEITEKRHVLQHHFKHLSREAVAGVFNRGLFLWMNGLFRRGFRGIFTIDNLFPIDEDILACSNPQRLSQQWNNASESLKKLKLL